MIHTDIEQGTPEWLALRRGKATGSRIVDVMATIKSGEAAGRRNYRVQLALERVTGLVAEGFSNKATDHGHEWEPVARAEYELRRRPVDQVTFVDHDWIAMAGASPDGLVDDDGCIEVKCPNSSTHVETLFTRKIPRDYMFQMQWVMECANRKWCDFVSYDPRMPEALRLVIIRVERDEEMLTGIRAEVIKFLTEVDELAAALTKMTLENMMAE